MRFGKGLFLLLLSSISLWAFESPVSFQSTTLLNSKSSDALSFAWTETLDFECHYLSPDSLQFILRRLYAHGEYQGQHYEIDTEDLDQTHYDLVCLKHFIDIPFEIKLNSNFEMIKPIEGFKKLEELTIQQETLFNEALLEKLVTAILSPKRYDSENNLLSFPLYFPFESTLTLSPNLSLQKKGSEIFFDQELLIEGVYKINKEPFSLQLLGDVSGEVQWDHDSIFCRRFQLHHVSDEKESEPLFKAPLQFEYTLNIKQIDHD